MSTWASTKKQAPRSSACCSRTRTSPTSRCWPPTRTASSSPAPTACRSTSARTGLLEGDLANPVPVPANVVHFDTPFLTDIAHNADPSPQDSDHNPVTPPVAPAKDGDDTPSANFAAQAPGTYDDEMLDAHFTAGDGRVNENIALTTIHQVFHSEHDRLVADIEDDAGRTRRTRRSARPTTTPTPTPAPERPDPHLRLRRAPLPGRPVRHRDGVPAPRLRGVRTQGAAGDPAVPRLHARHEPGRPGRVRPRRLPLRPLDARRRRGPPQRERVGQLGAAAEGVPEPAGVLPRRHRGHPHARSRRPGAS